MNKYTFHIGSYDLAFLGTIFIGLTFALLLWFAQSINQAAKRFLGLALAVMALWMIRLFGIDISIGTYYPHWSWLPLQFSLALGPLIFFYVLKLTQPAHKFSWKDPLHFSPLLLQQGVLVLAVKESIKTGAATYDTAIFRELNPVLHLAAFISVITYLYWSHRLIERFYQRLKFNNVSDRYRYELRWLHRLLAGFGLLWLLWIPYTAVDYFYYHHQSGIQAYYPLYILLALTMIRIAVAAFFGQEVGVPGREPPVSKPPPSGEFRQKGIWLKKAVEAGLFYRDSELSIPSLAEALDMHPYELSRIINIAFRKNFSDFINEYRIREVTRKMQDPAYDRLTLLGIAFDSGFNSKTTFNRTFKQMTGKNPAEYKNDLKKERPFYKLERLSGFTPVVSCHEPTYKWSCEQSNRNFMWSNYLKIAWRNLIKNKAHTFINVTGLSVGMAVAMLIGLWVWDELSYDKYFRNYDRIVQVMQHQTFNGDVGTQATIPLPLGTTLREDFKGNFKYVILSTGTRNHSIAYKEKILKTSGSYMQAEAPDMFTLHMLKGNRSALKDQSSIMLSVELAGALFGDADPLNQIITLDNKYEFKVSGVYEDLPRNTSFNDMAFIAPWDSYMTTDPNLKMAATKWDHNAWQLYAQLNPGADIDQVSARIKNVKMEGLARGGEKSGPATIFLHPMSKWHLYAEFKNGVNAGGKIEFVWMFGIIGVFVLLLACINFMNLSTARSEKRAKEVGIRKTLGSVRTQLISQFFSESLLVSGFALVFCIIVVLLALPWFNQLSDKDMSILWASPAFWAIGFGFSIVTGIIAGSYPAFTFPHFSRSRCLKALFVSERWLPCRVKYWSYCNSRYRPSSLSVPLSFSGRCNTPKTAR